MANGFVRVKSLGIEVPDSMTDAWRRCSECGISEGTNCGDSCNIGQDIFGYLLIRHWLEQWRDGMGQRVAPVWGCGS